MYMYRNMGMNFMYLLGFVLNFLQNEKVCKKNQ